MTRSPAHASVIVIGLLVGVPALVLRRLVTTELLPVQSTDLFLVVIVVLWASLVKAITRRDMAVAVNDPNKTPLQDGIAQLVDHSVLGVGFDLPEAVPTSPLAARVTEPLPVEALELPPIVMDFSAPPVDDAEPIVVPLLEAEEAPLLQGPTVEYIVVRGDTWWSIADVLLEDGRQWRDLARLNQGRQVAPDHVLADDEELRIGWSILLPATALDEENAHV